MEDVKGFLKKYSSFVVLIVLMGIMVITGRIIATLSGERGSFEKTTEEVWEPSAITESTEPVSVLTAEEEKNLQDEAMSAAKQCMGLYKEVEIVYPGTEYSYVEDFSEKQRKEAVKQLGDHGFVSVSDGMNMENYRKMEDFYSVYSSGRDAMVTVFSVHREGNIGALTFVYRNGKIQSYYVSIGWREGGIPEIKSFGIKDLEEIKLTEKGYFIYTYAETIAHGNLREYYRVKPLSDECRELTGKYIYGLSFVNYNMLVTNWDAGNVEEILMPCMFEDIYRVYTGEPFRAEGGLIPAEIYERVMTTCFPVSVEQVRQYCGYHAEADGYEYEMIFGKQFPPFGEVVDYKQNEDGTITLYVDCVWPDCNSDYAFTNRIVVKPFEDGTFRYLSNVVEQKELELPRIEKWEEGRTDGEKGYDLPVDARQREEAKEDCIKMMGFISELYQNADKGCASNVVIAEEVIDQMVEKLKKTGCPVTATALYSNMENYKELEDFLSASTAGSSGSVVVYEIHSDGGIGRYKYSYDGKDMYVLFAKAAWSDDDKPVITYISYTRIKEWRFTDKGWFCYKLCVPEYPEVMEIVDGSCMVRVKPQTKENREMSEKYVLGLAYQGNNLLCSDWDADHMENLDYHGMYEYLYAMKYRKRFPSEDYTDGIPKEEFERLIMEYLPVTAQEIQEYAVFDKEKQTYAWAELGCSNYTPTYFGTSFPEVTDIRENKDGTVTLTVDAVCSMILCDDAVITHELTVQFAEDGSFQYLGNKILDDGILKIPEYQYRMIRE